MKLNKIKNEIRNIIQGKSSTGESQLIQTVASFLTKSIEASGVAQKRKPNKDQETAELIQFINTNNLWFCDIDFNLFIANGAEQRVYIKNNKTVLKLNDSIYYASWVDYFNSLLLNNYFFPDTAYTLVGFYKSDLNVLYALVEQNYVEAHQQTNLNAVKIFLQSNGFSNTKNNDYYCKELGIILEDLHDENVLTANDILYFIDTVFYINHEILFENIE